MKRPSSLHVDAWAGKPSQPEDAFLETLAELARRDGRAACRQVALDIDALTPSRLRWRPSSQPSVAHLANCLSQGPANTAYLRGIISALRPVLGWEKAPIGPEIGPVALHHAFCRIVGAKDRIPSTSLQIGILIIDANCFRAIQPSAVDELFLPLSGEIVVQVDGKHPKQCDNGRFMMVPRQTPYTFWTGAQSVLIVSIQFLRRH